MVKYTDKEREQRLREVYAKTGIEYPFDKPVPEGIIVCTRDKGCVYVGADGKVPKDSPVPQDYVDEQKQHVEQVRKALDKIRSTGGIEEILD